MPSSDIDLMVIGEVDLDALDGAIDRIEEEIGRTVNYTLFEVGEWQERVTQRHSLYTLGRQEPKRSYDLPEPRQSLY